jgi:hypothetical protein
MEGVRAQGLRFSNKIEKNDMPRILAQTLMVLRER